MDRQGRQDQRCAAVVKGGRRFSFAAMVVVGNGRGKVGWGYGKANEVPPSVEKAVKDGQRSMVEIPLDGTIPAPREGAVRRGRQWCWCRPAPGTGVIAGAAVRAVCEAAGIHDMLTKSFGSTNPVNLVKATIAPCKQFAARQRSRAAARSDAVMNLNDVHRGIKKNKKPTRVGRGPGSGQGKTSGRGHKGQGQLAGWSAASGVRRRRRMPLIRRIPKRGFNNQWAAKVAERERRANRTNHSKPAKKSRLDARRKGFGQGAFRPVQGAGRWRTDEEAQDFGPSVQQVGPGKDREGGRRSRSCCPAPAPASASKS